MKLFTHKLMVMASAVTIAFSTVGVGVPQAYAADNTIEVTGTTQTALQNALNLAAARGTAGQQVTVSVPAGTYRLSSPLIVGSHTRLLSTPNTVYVSAHPKAQTPKLMLVGAGNAAAGYNGTRNATIEGGQWNLGGSESSENCAAFVFHHADGISIQNVTVKNCNHHMVNLSASRNSSVTNSTFRNDWTPSTKRSESWNNYDAREAVHLDSATYVGSEYDPATGKTPDGTPAGNITVSNCRFENIAAGIGNHHTVAEANSNSRQTSKTYRYSGTAFTVTNNVFVNVHRAVNVASQDNVVISGNTVQGSNNAVFAGFEDAKGAQVSNNKGTGGAVLISDGSTVTMSGQEISNVEYGVVVRPNSTLVASNLTITGASVGVFAMDSSKLTLRNSTISNSTGAYAVRIGGSSTGTIESNTIKNSAKVGISLNGAGSGIQILKNQISGSKTNGIDIGSAPNVRVENNCVSGSGDKDITVWNTGSGAVVRNNSISAASKIFTASGVSASNNNVGTCTASAPAPAPAEQICSGYQMLRLYNPQSGEHLYTKDANERNVLMNQHGWNYEGVAWCAPKAETKGQEVYRLFQPQTGEHHYTRDTNEVKVLTSQHGWRNEGIGWYSDPKQGVALTRLYNPYVPPHASHHYTSDENEWKTLNKYHKWNLEGIAWYGEQPIQ